MIAVFEGMLHVRDGKKSVVIAKGPFTVEVCANGYRAGAAAFIARLKPTNDQFFEAVKSGDKWNSVPMTRSSEAELRIQIEHRFAKKIRDWHEVGDSQPSAATDGPAVAPRRVE
jgi:hypothetical protein